MPPILIDGCDRQLKSAVLHRRHQRKQRREKPSLVALQQPSAAVRARRQGKRAGRGSPYAPVAVQSRACRAGRRGRQWPDDKDLKEEGKVARRVAPGLGQATQRADLMGTSWREQTPQFLSMYDSITFQLKVVHLFVICDKIHGKLRLEPAGEAHASCPARNNSAAIFRSSTNR